MWKSGVEAQVSFDLEFSSVTFFDTKFLENRENYKPNKEFKALIYGVAYSAWILKDEK